MRMVIFPIHTTGPSSTVEEIPTTIIEDVVSTIHTIEPSSTVDSSPTTIIEDIVPTVNEDPDVTQIHTIEPSSTVDSSPTTINEDIVPTVNEDPDVTQTTLSQLSSPDVTFIMPVDDMPQTPGRKKIVKRIVKNVNIKDLPAKKRKRDNEDEDGYTGLRPRDVLRISRKGCGT
uniref:Merozoite surface antigen 2 n=1 Tax=Solanum tuberosum TaxID=4113 RepID=M1E094_SOLTU